ncbi:hypothetical protein MRX96_008341 [Rhipicephalus microplus]
MPIARGLHRHTPVHRRRSRERNNAALYRVPDGAIEAAPLIRGCIRSTADGTARGNDAHGGERRTRGKKGGRGCLVETDGKEGTSRTIPYCTTTGCGR